MLFLVKGKIHFTPYMGDTKKPREETRLVEAEDQDEAERKYERHYRSMSIANDDSYSTSDVEAFSTIL